MNSKGVGGKKENITWNIYYNFKINGRKFYKTLAKSEKQTNIMRRLSN